MDITALRRHLLETVSRFEKKISVVARAVQLAPSGYGLLLKSQKDWECLQLHLTSEQQGFRISSKWDESPYESRFTRALSRHLKDASIERIELIGENDRIVRFSFLARDSFFYTKKRFYLICEFTGRIANLLLCDDAEMVLEQVNVTGNNNLHEKYKLPVTTASQLVKAQTTLFLSPLMAKEANFRLKVSPNQNLNEVFKELSDEINDMRRAVKIYFIDGRLPIVSVFDLKHLEVLGAEVFECSTVNEALETIDREWLFKKRLENLRGRVLGAFEKDLRVKEELLQAQAALEIEYADAEFWRRAGELLLTYGKDIPPRAKQAVLNDWESGREITIQLDPARTPSQNAQKCFQRYKKALRGHSEAAKRIEQLKGDIAWLKEQIWFCKTATSASDLLSALPMAKSSSSRKNSEAAESSPKKIKPFLEIEGCRFYVGRNGKQNEEITFKLGKRGDMWFHADDVPGSHVVARRTDGTLTSEDIHRGALLAAWFSFARESSKTPVDYTDIAFVKRVPGGGAGRVSYTHQKTIFVNPRDALKLLEINLGNQCA